MKCWSDKSRDRENVSCFLQMLVKPVEDAPKARLFTSVQKSVIRVVYRSFYDPKILITFEGRSMPPHTTEMQFYQHLIVVAKHILSVPSKQGA